MVGKVCAVVTALLCIACICWPAAGRAAPARLNDEIPDAVPDPDGMWSFGYGFQSIGLEGPLTDSTSTHNVFRLRYQVSPDASAAVTYGTHSLASGPGLLNPLFDNQDSATALGFDLRLNLVNEPAKYEVNNEDIETFVAGSAFDLGVSLERMRLTASSLDQDDTLLRAYLAYSTDLSEQLRAHTFFSTGRVSGDTHTGSVNRVGAGLDYTLIEGQHPLVLMADAVLDVYNFRQPTFNTSRITSFDVGLRYGFNPNLYGSLGWMTYNDSENDASGSGVFAGLQWLSEAPEHGVLVEGPPAPVEPAALEVVPGALAPAEPVVAVIEPELPAADAPTPVVEQQPGLAETAHAEASQTAPVATEQATTDPTATPIPEPIVESLPVDAAPAEAEPLVLPDGRADRPVRQRVVSALQEEFTAAPLPTETQDAEPAASAYDPRSWEDDSELDAAPGSAGDDDGIDIPQLDLFPETIQASSGDIRPRLKRMPRASQPTFSRQAPSTKEQPLPSDDQTVVEVEITGDPPADG